MSANTTLALSRLASALAALLFSFSASAQIAPAWVSVRAIGAGTSSIGGAAVDAAGNTYEAGSFTAPGLVIDGTTLASRGGTDAYLAKYSPAGALVWVRQIGSIGTDVGMAVALDAAGNAYVAGMAGGPLTLGTVSLGGTSSRTFLVRYSPQGIPLWGKESGGAGLASGSGMAIDAAGTVHLSGSFSRTITFDATSTTSPNNGFAVYLARFSSATGAALGVTTAFHYALLTGTASYSVPKMAIAATGDVYLLNTFTQPVIFGSTTLTSRGASDVLVARFSPLGAQVWGQQLGGNAMDFVNACAVDAAGNLYVAGTFTGPATFENTTLPGAGDTDGFLARYSAQGNLDWVQALAGPGSDGFNAVALDAAGNPYATGNFSPGAQLGTLPLANAGNSDILVAAFTPQGQPRWQQQAGGPGTDSPIHLNLHPSGDLHLMGRFTDTCVFGPLSLTTAATVETFLARLRNPALATRAPQLQALAFYPNPATDVVRLPGLPIGSHMQLFDALGRVVRKTTVSAAAQVSVQGLAPGLYRLHTIDLQGNKRIGRLVIQ